MRGNICEVTFTKVSDGSTRVMRCTLNAGLLEKNGIEGGTTARKPNPNILSVFDIDENDWRSFRIANVTGATIVQ